MQEFRSSYSENHQYTNKETMLELGYDSSDVVEEIRMLTVADYLETMQDNMQGKTNSFYVFIKEIKYKQVYIKIKIRENRNNVFCVSFHFAEHNVEGGAFPYK